MNAESFESRCFREAANRLAGCAVEAAKDGSVRMALGDVRGVPVGTWRSAHEFLFGGVRVMSVFEVISDEIRCRARGFTTVYSDFAARNAWAQFLSGCASPEELALKMGLLP